MKSRSRGVSIGVVIAIAAALYVTIFLPKDDETEKNASMKTLAHHDIHANHAFFYYEDLDKAVAFYSDVLGLEKVLDYGFAKIFQISQSSYIGLVKGGMHSTDEPKTVTLSFVTQEVDAWHDYLTKQKVPIRNPLGDATRHPTRGFVALDPEGYFLEFETFLDHPQNVKLHAGLKSTKSLYPKKAETSGRPAELGFQATILWLYYRDIPAAQKFYEEVMGFQMVVDQGLAKVYHASPTGFIGLVDESKGLHRASEKKAVNVSFFTRDLDAWFKQMRQKDIALHSSEIGLESDAVRVFLAYDPEGYYLEFDDFLDQEVNQAIRSSFLIH